jgi:hypothetical protein
VAQKMLENLWSFFLLYSVLVIGLASLRGAAKFVAKDEPFSAAEGLSQNAEITLQCLSMYSVSVIQSAIGLLFGSIK